MLPPVPADFQRSRDGLHALAFYVLSAARRHRTGRIGLEWTPGGFGTPVFDRRQIRIEGVELVVEEAGATDVAAGTSSQRRAPITTLAAAGALVGVTPDPADKSHFDVLDMPAPDAPLGVTAATVALLDAWFRVGTEGLDDLRRRHADRSPTPSTLWPEHFDVAIELGDESRGERATYGVSPGDRDHAEPYAYVSAWRAVDREDPFWNDLAFSGASLPYATIVAAPDPAEALLEFFERGVDALSRPGPG